MQKLDPKTYPGLTKLSDYFENFLDKLEIHYESALFRPDWSLLLQDRCPICTCKLYQMRNKPRWYCRSKKNKHRFTIPSDRLAEIKIVLNDKIKE